MKLFVNRYFEQYEKEKVPRKNGKGTRIQFKYVGDFYRLAISDRRWKALKVIYPAIAAVFLGLYIYLALRPVSSNYSEYVGLFVILMVFPVYFLIYGIVCFIAAKRDMTIREYRESVRRVFWGSMAACILNAGVVIAQLVFFSSRDESVDTIQTLGFSVCFILMLGIFLLALTSRSYVLIENPNKPKKPKKGA